ncbi:Protein of unknown function DUF616 [Candidatus Nanopelagicaceae bacterium]
MAKRCIYTVLTGSNEELFEQDIITEEEVDFICFSDRPRYSTTWDVRIFASEIPLDESRMSRIPKILPHKFLFAYEESIYIDNSVKLTKDPYTYLQTNDIELSVLEHSFRNSLKMEFIEVVILSLDELSRVSEQYLMYVSSGADLDDIKPLWGGIIYRRHNNEKVKRAMEIWWEHVLRYSRRDQLSLPIALMQTNLYFKANQYDNHNSPFHLWPQVKRERHQSQTWRVNHKENLSKMLSRPIEQIAYVEPVFEKQNLLSMVSLKRLLNRSFPSK